MSISDLYPSGYHEQNVGHFATIVQLALRDNVINEDEQVLLERLAVRLDISKEEFKEILKDPSNYPIAPPVSHERRIERLYDLTRMMFLDENPTIDKTSIMDRIAVGLGFPVSTARKVVKASIDFFLKKPDLEDFKEAIMKVEEQG